MRKQNILPLDNNEQRKRKREGALIVVLSLLFVLLTVAEFELSEVSKNLPFVTSIFFFGLLNINLIILIGLVWLVLRNIGKLFIERRRKILGARLKTKLVIAFLSFSVIPTLLLFVISALYINSSFEKWFSLKIQNTLQASLEITGIYYRNTENTALHFANYLSRSIPLRILSPSATNGAVQKHLDIQRDLLALDAVELYLLEKNRRVLSQVRGTPAYPAISMEILQKAFANGSECVVQRGVGNGDLIRCMVALHVQPLLYREARGILVVNSYVPVSLRSRVNEIANVFDDYKDINPLKYPMKTTYLLILIMITLVILFVAIWVGLYMARELTDPVERLVQAAQSVGAGNLDITILGAGHDEIAVLVESFNKMTQDLRENRERLIQAGADLEKRRLELEAILANIGTGVVAIDSRGEITTFNGAVSRLFKMDASLALRKSYGGVFVDEGFSSLVAVIERTFATASQENPEFPQMAQWSHHAKDGFGPSKVLVAMGAPVRQEGQVWGVVVVIDEITHLIKGQREMAWREVARRIAHEIKNPLTPIKLSAQRLQRRFAKSGHEDAALLNECTETIIKHTDELKEMVNEFSHFARFPESSPAPHDLNQALLEVTQLFQQAHPDIHFSCHFDKNLPIFDFDRDHMKRVIINLMDNAIAALNVPETESLKENRITLSTRYKEELQMALIEVEDNGIGLAEDVKERVFEPYFSTKKEGTGLGLSIAKRIVNDHNGFIRVKSGAETGTQFTIEIPTQFGEYKKPTGSAYVTPHFDH